MATTNITMRIDEDLKSQLQELVSNLGMDMTTFFTISAKQAVREQRIPFAISMDVPNADTIRAIEDVRMGRNLSRSFSSVEELMEDSKIRQPGIGVNVKDIRNIKVMEEYMRMCDEGVMQGWHERNGGNLSYRMRPGEVEECRPYFKEIPGEWVYSGVREKELGGEYFIVTGSGKHFKNVSREPENNVCILELNEEGDQYRIVWGLEKGGRPTSELPTHFLNHSVRKRVTEGKDRVIYHAHTPYVAAMTHVLPLEPEAFTKVLWKSETECCMFFPEGLGVVPWMVPGGIEIARATCAQMEKYGAVVWGFHGMFAAGEDFDSAFGMMQVIEKACHIASVVLSAAHGGKCRQHITDDDLRRIGRELGLDLNEDVLHSQADKELFG